MKYSLNKFNNICESIQVTSATANGKELKVTNDNKGNINISGQVPIQQQNNIQQINQPKLNDQESTYGEQQENDSDILFDLLKEQLETMLIHATEASKSAKHYIQFSNPKDKLNVMYNYGYAEGQKNIIKLVLKKLNEL